MTASSVTGPVLETERLMLRLPSAEDFEAWVAFTADPEASRFLGGPQGGAVAWRNMCTMAGSWLVMGFGNFSVIEKATGRWIGRIGPRQPEGWPGPEVGWALASEAWGRGYAVEGATATIDWAFDALGWSEVCIEPSNTRSRKVAERLGSSILRQSTLPEPLGVKVDVWGQTRDEWLARGSR
jgi:RimJ/RimL family protein N-acetyltransferase